jgi:hypothetical protein
MQTLLACLQTTSRGVLELTHEQGLTHRDSSRARLVAEARCLSSFVVPHSENIAARDVAR